jgi:2OG-Fe(II) oxygenase superfamily
MWQTVGKKLTALRGDTLVALGIPLGCAALLAEAYFRTELGDAECPTRCAFGQSSNVVKEHHVRELEKKGIVVIQNALLANAVLAARQDIQKFRAAASGFVESCNDVDVRQDEIAWMKYDSETSTDKRQGGDAQGPVSDGAQGNGLVNCIRLVRGISNALEKWEYAGSHTHKVPRQCQLAMYRGNGKASYKRHLDRCSGSMQELGLLEWLRLSDYRGRSITVILYLNEPDRPKINGGALRCWVSRGTTCAEENDGGERLFSRPFDIQPTGGTLVIFQSDKVEHMVLASSVDRYALTSWVNGSIEDRICP